MEIGGHPHFRCSVQGSVREGKRLHQSVPCVVLSPGQAYQQEKTIGTLAWLWYVRASGTLTLPADQLLHYPIPDHPADGFDKEVCTFPWHTSVSFRPVS